MAAFDDSPPHRAELRDFLATLRELLAEPTKPYVRLYIGGSLAPKTDFVLWFARALLRLRMELQRRMEPQHFELCFLDAAYLGRTRRALRYETARPGEGCAPRLWLVDRIDLCLTGGQRGVPRGQDESPSLFNEWLSSGPVIATAEAWGEDAVREHLEDRGQLDVRVVPLRGDVDVFHRLRIAHPTSEERVQREFEDAREQGARTPGALEFILSTLLGQGEAADPHHRAQLPLAPLIERALDGLTNQKRELLHILAENEPSGAGFSLEQIVEIMSSGAAPRVDASKLDAAKMTPLASSIASQLAALVHLGFLLVEEHRWHLAWPWRVLIPNRLRRIEEALTSVSLSDPLYGVDQHSPFVDALRSVLEQGGCKEISVSSEQTTGAIELKIKGPDGELQRQLYWLLYDRDDLGARSTALLARADAMSKLVESLWARGYVVHAPEVSTSDEKNHALIRDLAEHFHKRTYIRVESSDARLCAEAGMPPLAKVLAEEGPESYRTIPRSALGLPIASVPWEHIHPEIPRPKDPLLDPPSEYIARRLRKRDAARILLHGPAGIGKTITMISAAELVMKNPPRIGMDAAWIPLFIPCHAVVTSELRDITAPLSLERFIAAYLGAKGWSPRGIEHARKAGWLAVFLDGLDEIEKPPGPLDQSDQVVLWLNTLDKYFEKCSVVVSCRSHVGEVSMPAGAPVPWEQMELTPWSAAELDALLQCKGLTAEQQKRVRRWGERLGLSADASHSELDTPATWDALVECLRQEDRDLDEGALVREVARRVLGMRELAKLPAGIAPAIEPSKASSHREAAEERRDHWFRFRADLDLYRIVARAMDAEDGRKELPVERLAAAFEGKLGADYLPRNLREWIHQCGRGLAWLRCRQAGPGCYLVGFSDALVRQWIAFADASARGHLRRGAET